MKFVRRWVLFTLILLIMSLAWSLASPIPSGPDEPTQYVKAAAVARGAMTGERPPGFPDGTVLVRVPATFVDLYAPRHGCYYSLPAMPAGCTRLIHVSGRLEAVSTYVGDYPPLYYALTGLPSLASPRPWALQAMRGVGALLSSLMLGLAFAVALTWSRSRWVFVGLAVAVTPMAIYLASVLNPSGLEVGAAAAMWTSGTVLVFHHDKDPPTGLIVAFAASAVVLSSSRPLSAAWVVAILAALIAMRPANVRRLLHVGRMRIAFGVIVLGLLLAFGYVAAVGGLAQEKFPLPRGTSTGHILALIVGALPNYARQIVGAYGTPDTVSPSLVVVIWVVASALLVGATLCLGRPREAVILGLVVVGVLVVLPVAAEFSYARSNGLLWQGRYEYPLAMGIPLLAGALIGERRRGPSARLALATSLALAVGDLASFYWVFRRYAVGLGATKNPFARVPGRWTPMVPAAVLVVVVVVTTIAFGAVLYAGSLSISHRRPTALAGRPVADS